LPIREDEYCNRAEVPLKNKIHFILLFLALTGCGASGNNPTIKGLVGPVVQVSPTEIVLNAVFKDTKISAPADVPVPGFPSSSIQLSTDSATGGTLFSYHVNIQDFFGSQGAGMGQETLPGGRQIPGVVGGALPGISVGLPGFGGTDLYFSANAIGIFVPSEHLGGSGSVIRTYRFYDQNKNPVGMVSPVGDASTGGNAGLLLLLDPALLGIKGASAREARLAYYFQLGLR
jgi:hypothetical protein